MVTSVGLVSTSGVAVAPHMGRCQKVPLEPRAIRRMSVSGPWGEGGLVSDIFPGTLPPLLCCVHAKN